MFDDLARLAGSADPDDLARRARQLVVAPTTRDPVAAGREIVRGLARSGFRDDPDAFALDDVLARGGGNCLGLTLVVGAALAEAGHAVRVAIRVGPRDDVHDAGAAYFDALVDAATGIDDESPLPEAGDRSAQYRFVPVEHTSLALGPDATPFEATGLGRDGDRAWAPDAESLRVVSLADAAGLVLSERAKRARAAGDVAAGLRLAVAAVRRWPGNREGWAEVWRLAGARPRLAAHAAHRYAALGGDDALAAFTRYQMTGDGAALAGALDRLPGYAPAYFEQHVLRAARPQRRDVAIAAWMYASSEILELEPFYRAHAELLAAVLGADELAELLASFA